MQVEEFATEAADTLGDSLVAVYQYGSNFARGPKAKEAHLLMVVENVEAPLLKDMRPLAKRAREANYHIRFDTHNDIVCCADVFPVFVLELIDTKSLLQGKDVLADLSVHSDHLRSRVEQNLRVLHRDLLAAFVADEDHKALALHLRQAVRRSVYLLRALGIACEIDLPKLPTVEQLIDEVVGKLLPDTNRGIWHRLRRMANYEDSVPGDKLDELFGETLKAYSELVDAVDKLEA